MNATTEKPAEGRRNFYEILSQPGAVQHLPSLRSILRELEEKTSFQQVPIQEIARIIRTDQSLSVRIIRLANSGYFSLGQPILDLDEAILYLGLNNVRTVVFTSRCIETTAALPSDLLDWTDFWRHSCAVASIARTLAANLRHDLGPMGAESYYLLGLLHDIGKLVLACVAPRDFEACILQARERAQPLHAAEMERLGADHAGIGAWYLQRQGVPAALHEPVRLHHNWRIDNGRIRHALLLNTADRLAHHLGIGKSGTPERVDEHPCLAPHWLDFVKRTWDPLNDPADHLKLIEDDLRRLPDLVDTMVT